MTDEIVFGVVVVVGASRVFGGAPRAIASNDGREAAGVVARRSVERGRGAQGAQVALRTPQGTRRKGKFVLSGITF